jgi:hypothetical protein
MPLIVGPLSQAKSSPPLGLGLGLGDPVGLGDGFGEPVGETLGLGLGVPLGEPLGLGLGLAHGDALGLGLGLLPGEALGLGLGFDPKVPESTTVLPSSIWIGEPKLMNGTCWPSSVRRLKKNVPHEPTVVWPATALLIDTVSTVPDGRLIENPSTSRRLRSSSTLYSPSPNGVTPPIGAPVSVA